MKDTEGPAQSERTPEQGVWSWGERSPMLPPPPPEPTPPAGPVSSRRSRLVLLVALAVVVVGGIAGGVVALSPGPHKVVAVSTPTPSASFSPSPTETPPPLPPAGFRAEADPLTIGVNLSWVRPSGGTEGTGYWLYRGKNLIAQMPAGSLEYTDTNVIPGKHYTYYLEARNGATLISEQVSVEIDVPVPALRDARVAGIFTVTLTPTSQYGYGNTLEKDTAGWSFKPKCAKGACDVTLTDLQLKELKAVLEKKGATHTGTDAGKFGTTCGGVTVVSTVTIEFHVVKAKAISGEWRATKLVGTFKDTEASQLGCRSSGATYTIVAELL
jgi:hypothetical protein